MATVPGTDRGSGLVDVAIPDGGHRMDTLKLLVVAALVATVLTMVLGILTMEAGREADDLYGIRIMWVRIGLQALTVALMVIALLIH